MRTPMKKMMLFALGLLCGLPLRAPAADGILAWAKPAGGTGSDVSHGIASLADGSFLVTGSFEGATTFGPGETHQTTLVSAGESDIFIARYNADGTLAWARRAGGVHACGAYGVAALADGSFLVTGYFADMATFGPGDPKETILTSKGALDIFVARYHADGTLAWAKRAGGMSAEQAYGVAAFADGSSCIAGEFWGAATFEPGEPGETTLTPTGSSDMFIARYRADGTLAWARRAGGTGAERAEGIAALADGSALVTGWFFAAATFGLGEANETTLTPAGGDDVFIARYNPDGTLAWARRAGGTDWGGGYGIAALDGGSALVTGFYQGTATFGPGEANETTLTADSGSSDMFIARYHADGTLAWARRAGGTDAGCIGLGVVALADGSALVTGYFYLNVTFGPGEAKETALTAANENIFIARYHADGTLAWAKGAGGSDEENRGLAVAAVGDGSALVTGYLNGLATFGAGEPGETSLTAAEANDIFIARFNLFRTPVRINFQPAASPVMDRFPDADTGAPYGDRRWNSWGWR